MNKEFLNNAKQLNVGETIKTDLTTYYLSQKCNYLSKAGKLFIHENKIIRRVR